MRYVIHLLRVGKATTLSLSVNFGGVNGGPHFEELRRLQCQKGSPDWFVPSNPDADCSLELANYPICFAPLSAASRRALLLGKVADECGCGEEEAGFGNECLVQQDLVLPDSDRKCFYIRARSAKDELNISGGSASLLGKGDLLQWLRDVTVSGKFAGIRFPDLGQESGLSMECFEVRNQTSPSKVSTLFHYSEKCRSLYMRSGQLVLSTTEDSTDGEAEVVPMTLVPHPPPIQISMSKEDTRALLLPEFSLSSRRSTYYECSLTGLPPQVEANTSDDRFQVEMQEMNLGKDCFDISQHELRYSAVRNQSRSVCDACEYQPWNNNYDLAIVSSSSRCVEAAIDMNELTAFKHITSWLHALSNTSRNRCGVLQRVVRLDRRAMLEELLTRSWDPDCVGCAATPLEVAASEGNVALVDLLLDHKADIDSANKDGSTALFAASRHCQARRVGSRGCEKFRACCTFAYISWDLQIL